MEYKPFIGVRFARWLVLEEIQHLRTAHSRYCRCRCECGNVAIVALMTLRAGTSRSCGCLTKERAHERAVHGEAKKTPEYSAWARIKHRCSNPHSKDWLLYGGRGIRVCDEWQHDFSAFLKEVGRRPSPFHSIDRFPNNDGNYEPGNVRWATARQQAKNRRARRSNPGRNGSGRFAAG